MAVSKIHSGQPAWKTPEEGFSLTPGPRRAIWMPSCWDENGLSSSCLTQNPVQPLHSAGVGITGPFLPSPLAPNCSPGQQRPPALAGSPLLHSISHEGLWKSLVLLQLEVRAAQQRFTENHAAARASSPGQDCVKEARTHRTGMRRDSTSEERTQAWEQALPPYETFCKTLPLSGEEDGLILLSLINIPCHKQKVFHYK